MTLSDKEQYARDNEEQRGLLGFSTEDVKAFIKKIKKHSFCTEEGLNVVDVNWINEEAGDKLI